MTTSGPTLRRERRKYEISTVDLHKAMGISRSTLYTLERAAEVEKADAARYRAALKTLRDAKGDQAA